MHGFFDPATFTITYVVSDPETRRAAIVDSVLDYDPKAGRTSTKSADAVVAFASATGLTVDWHPETHAHADHLSAAPYLQEKLGGRIAIGARCSDGACCTSFETAGADRGDPPRPPQDEVYLVEIAKTSC